MSADEHEATVVKEEAVEPEPEQHHHQQQHRADQLQQPDDHDLPPYKRAKRDPNVDPMNPSPSIVVHVRNLSFKATEADLIEALSHFGTIAYATCVPQKRMALVEFEEVEGAEACVNYSQNNEIYVAGQPAQFNYSTSKYIQRLGLESETPNHVIIVAISNVQYPINVDVIYKVTKPYGQVKRIAMIRKQQVLQALVEYEDVATARSAKHAMNGADIYSGCCTLKVEFAKPDTVKVTRNDQDQWDFTVPAETLLPPEIKEQLGRKTLIPPGQQQQPAMGYGGAPAVGYGAAGGYNAAAQQQAPVIPPFSAGPPPIQQPYNRPAGQYPTTARDRVAAGGGPAQNTYSAAPVHYGGPQGGYGGGGHGYEESQVVMIYGITHDQVNCDRVFNLLCLYGNVEKVKFMKSKLDTVMVQMGKSDEVSQCINNLHGVTLFGQTIALRPSKQPNLRDTREPFELPDGTSSVKDFMSSRQQRFSTAESARRNRVISPTNTLHWYNAPPDITENTLKQVFETAGATAPVNIVIFQGKSERSASGLAEFGSVEESIDALVLTNHTPVESEASPNPYLVKMAFAVAKDRSGRGGDVHAAGEEDEPY